MVHRRAAPVVSGHLVRLRSPGHSPFWPRRLQWKDRPPSAASVAPVSSTALVRYRGNDYSVPTAHGFQAVVVKGFVEAVVILCDGVPIARHARSYGHGEFV